MTEPIPGPPGLPWVGNILDIDLKHRQDSYVKLYNEYGPVFKLYLAGRDRIFVSTHELLNEIFDETRFQKIVSGTLLNMRDVVHDGLVTAFPGEHNWGVAHRILLPALGPLAIKSMFDEMYDISSQMVLKWARCGSKVPINLNEDFGRLTLDTISLCTMDLRFNSFYREELDPFFHAFHHVLGEAGLRANRPLLQTWLMRHEKQKFDENKAYIRGVAEKVISDRRANPTEKKDLLTAMISGRDIKTGEGLTDQSIADNLITFLIAGHETSSALLSFIMMYLIQTPRAYKCVQDEVDSVVGNDSITVTHLSRLPYINACIREALRLQPPAPLIAVQPNPRVGDDKTPIILGGKYTIPDNATMVGLLTKVHRDPAVYGDDAEEFKPERMFDEQFKKLPKNAWKPFGNGLRGCIGRAFAWQESLLAICILFKHFDFKFVDPDFKLVYNSTLTIKPMDLFVTASLRPGISAVDLGRNLHSTSDLTAEDAEQKHESEKVNISRKETLIEIDRPMFCIFYGSNSGTCKELAHALASSAFSRGYQTVVEPLNNAINVLPRNVPVVIITASYNGEAPDSAAHFVTWLKNTTDLDMDGVKYAIFGCGHRDWESTYQKIPSLVDSLLFDRGAERIAERGCADVADGDTQNEFEHWVTDKFWIGMTRMFGERILQEDCPIEVTMYDKPRSMLPSSLAEDMIQAVVLENYLLTSKGEPPKRHMKLKLPFGQQYQTGDYLQVLPKNSPRTVTRALKRFKISPEVMLSIKSLRATFLPTNQLISARRLFEEYVELGIPATTKNMLELSRLTQDPQQKVALQEISENQRKNVNSLTPKPTALDLLDKFPSIDVSFNAFLLLLPPIRIRQYSISSSPLQASDICTLTWSVHGQRTYGEAILAPGLASNYLALLKPGDLCQVAVQASHFSFHLPPAATLATIPIIMACAGTGLAPFRGFISERAHLLQKGLNLAPAILYVGCRHPDRDVLYPEEFRKWNNEGVVDIRYAFSQLQVQSKNCKYVQDRIWEDREELAQLWKAGAQAYVCGSPLVGDGIRNAVLRIYIDVNRERGVQRSAAQAQEWFTRMRASSRYAVDVFI